MAAAQLRAPLYEDKVVDFLFDKAEITERAVSREELEAAIEADEDGHVHGPGCGHDHDHDHGDKPKAKKAAAKKKDVTADESVRSEEHTSELQSLMRISYAVFCLKKKKKKTKKDT